MATKHDTANKNIQKRRRERATKNFFKKVGIVFLSLLILFSAGIAGVYIAHSSTTNREIDILKENNFYNLVEVEDKRNINVVSYGNTESEHTIVTISSIGTNDFTVYVKHMIEPIKDDIHVALIDRAGHGMSDDSSHEQTLEQIISDYRTALKKAGIDGPYILLAQQFGSVYATYWESKYPDEVEAIIYLDGTIINKETKLNTLDVKFSHKAKSLINKIGLQRLFDGDVYVYASDSLIPTEAASAKIMNFHSVCTSAYLSEMALMKKNFDQVLDNFDDTETDKMYISSSLSFTNNEEAIEYCKHKNDKNNELGVRQFYNLSQSQETIDKDMANMIENCSQQYNKTVLPFVSDLGSCQIARIPGDAKIYEQNPGAILEAIVDFVMYLDDDIPEIKSYYKDSIITDWEQYREDHIEEFKAYEDKNKEQVVPEEENKN